MKYYIGLDAHAKTSTAVVVDKDGKVIAREKFKTTEGNLLKFIKSVRGEKHLTFEETHLAQWLYVLLKDRVDKLVVCNPVFVAEKQGSKTDFRDALHLAQELRTNHLVAVYHDESHWIELRTLVYGYIALVDEIVRSKNRLKAIFRSEAIDTSDSDFYEIARDRLPELSHSSAKFVAESLYWQIDGLEKRKREYREVLRRNAKKYRPIRNLMTVPGIDIVRASILSAVVCMPHRFKNKHQFWAYCMLARHLQISDGKIYGNKKVHGRAELKELFLGAAESAMRTETSLRKYYDKLRLRGIGHPEAKRSLARKIASTTLTMLKNNESYKDDYDEQQQRRAELRKQLNEATV
jgi:transposase